MPSYEKKTVAQPFPVVRFQNVEKEYALGARKLKVLDGVSFTVTRGEFVSIMGPSGSGKSTLLQLMGCLDRPTRGKILIDGVDVSTLTSNGLADLRAHKIGFVFQAFNLLSTQSALKNVELALAINEVPKAARLQRARQLLAHVGLSDREGHKPNELSGGEKQRVAIARALANSPAFLLADEPTGNLDSKSGQDVMELFNQLWKSGTTVVLVTHEPVVAQYSRRILHVRDGKIEREEFPVRASGKDIKWK